MFTVIMLSDAAKSIFEPARVYFEPFIESGQIALCDWDQSLKATETREALPGLSELIKGKSAWRAVVVDHPRGALNGESNRLRDPENPFDFLDNTNLALGLAESRFPLIRIAHMLLGYPQLSAKYFEPYMEYEDSDTGERVSGSPRKLLTDFIHQSQARVEIELVSDERSDDEWFRLAATTIGERHNQVRRLFREVPYNEHEHELHAELAKRYDMKEIRPQEVVFISTRVPMEDDEKAELRRAWRTDTEHIGSRFIERNDYPPMSRFAVYELVDAENSGYEQDQLRFWLSTLTAAINQLPPGGFQADRVYQLGVEFASDGLGEMLNEHLSKLANARDRLDRIIHVVPKEPDLNARDLLQTVETPVVFDDLKGDGLLARTSGYGYVTDRPTDEHLKWVGEVNKVSGQAALFMRKPRRAVSRAVVGARQLAKIHADEETPLSVFDMADLDEALAKRLQDLVVPATANILDQSSMNAAIHRGDRSVRDYINQRMRSTTVTTAAAVALGIWLVALLPYLMQSARWGFASLVSGAGLVLLVLAIVATAGFVSLWAFKLGLQRRIRGFNQGVTQEINEVKSGADSFALFLSHFVTYRRGAERLRNAAKMSELQTIRLRRLRSLRARIGEKIREEKEIVKGIGVPLQMHSIPDSLYTFDPDAEDSDQSLFGFPPGEMKIPFNESGEYIDGPYDFVTKLSLTRLSIYETGSGAESRVEA